MIRVAAYKWRFRAHAPDPPGEDTMMHICHRLIRPRSAPGPRPRIAALLACVALIPGVFAKPAVPPPAADLVAAFNLATNYTQALLVEGLPIVGSAAVSPYALREAEFLIRQQIGHRPDLLRAMAAERIRFVVMAPTEMTTDIPEHSDLRPASYWNRRARGLGATAARPAVSCGEENLLCLPGDPYSTENILIHEFAHVIHEWGMKRVDPTFDDRLLATYLHARSNGLWKGTYAMENRAEYWAEGTQSWFDTNRADDNEHGPVDTRDEVKQHDPELARLLAEVYGDGPWRYQRPAARSAADQSHLAGFDPAQRPGFRWPPRAKDPAGQGERLTWLPPDQLPAASPRGEGSATSIVFVNRRAGPVQIAWIDFKGKRKDYGAIRPGVSELLSTYPGHAWVFSEQGVELGGTVAGPRDGRIEIR